MEWIKGCEISINGIDWFVAENDCILCQQVNGTITCRAVLPDKDKVWQSYNAIYELNGKMFLVPYKARYILVYDIENMEYFFLENNELKVWREVEFKYATSLRQGNFLYLFGRRVPYVVKIDMNVNEIVLLSDLAGVKARKLQEIETVKGLFFASNYVIHKEVVWIPIVGVGILELHLENDIMQLHELQTGCCAICKAEEDTFWIYASGRGCIVRWSSERGILDVIDQINLHSEVGEVRLAYDHGTLICESWIESICINVSTGQHKIKKMQKKEQFFVCDQWDERAAYDYLQPIEDIMFMEHNLGDFGNALSLYLKYVREDDKEVGFSGENCSRRNLGTDIYNYINNTEKSDRRTCGA